MYIEQAITIIEANLNKTLSAVESLTSQVSSLTDKINALKAAAKNTAKGVCELYTVEEAAAYLNLKNSTVRRMCSLGVLPYTKRGKRNYFTKEDLDTYQDAISMQKLSKEQIEVEANRRIQFR
ncbi:helix-turn-helix domain-containing protein [Hoylesella nanceiensis]|uniref:helix-turn-helix domain-containing protein n=1 Tax=Hoylesella nanceiensis TaxID=425941 RepID=UPI0028EB334A|nr:helix-turn-helix domain-containing protein [Hoylesella nanceiensis]